MKNQYIGSGSILLKKAIPKYGKDNFEVEIIKTLEEKYGICTGAMITPEAVQKSIQTHIAKYGSVCGHMLTPEKKSQSKKTRELKYGHSMGACHTPEGENLQVKDVIKHF